MAQFLWGVDVASGVMRNHALSNKLRFAAVADAVIAPFCKAEPNFGKGKGDTINITRIKAVTVPTSITVSEDNDIPVDTFSQTSTGITVTEIGRAVEYSSLAQDLQHYDLENAVQKQLKKQLQVGLDNMAAEAFDDAYVCAIPTSATGITWDTDGTPSTAATNNLSVAHCGVIRDYMRDTLMVPYYEGENYIGIAATKALRGIKSDSDFMEWRKYLQPGDVLYKSEVGMVEQIKFVECNNTTALSGTAGTGSVLGECFIFGEDAVALAEVLTPELRAAIPGNFGRKKAVAWYGILQFGLIWAATATAGEARVVRVTSS